MNGNLPECTDKTPIRAALEDTIVVFLSALFAAVLALMSAGVDISNPAVFVGPVVAAGLVGVNTYAKVRDINIPAKEEPQP